METQVIAVPEEHHPHACRLLIAAVELIKAAYLFEIQ